MPDMSVAPAPQPTETQPLPMNATPDQFGAGVFGEIAQGAAGLAGRMEERREIDLKNQYDAQVGQGQLGVAQLRAATDELMQAQQDAQAGPTSTYAARVMAAYDNMAQQAVAGVQNPLIQRQIKDQVDELRAHVQGKASMWQSASTAAQSVGNVKVVRDVLAGQAYGAKTTGDFEGIARQWADTVYGIKGITEQQQQQLANQGISEFALGFGQGMAENDPAQARRLFDAGYFSAHGVDGDSLHVLDRMIQNGQHRADAELKAQAHAREMAAVAGAEAIKRTIDNGGSVPLPTLIATEKAMRSFGPEHAALADELHVAGIKIDVNAQYGASQPQAVAHLAQSEAAKVAAMQARGETVSLDQGARVKALNELATQLSDQAASDPWALAAKRGIVPTPFDINAPNAAQVLANRVGQAQVLARTLGPGYRMMPLQKPEAEQIKQIFANGGEQDQLRAMSIIAAQEAHMPGSTAAIFNQVEAPEEFRFAAALMTGSNPQGVQTVNDMLRGYHALQKMPNLVDAKKFSDRALPVIGAAMGGNLQALAGNPRAIGVIAASRAIYAAMAASKGFTPESQIDDKMMRQAINRAMGAYTDAKGQQRGGLGDWHGAMWLPDGASQAEFNAKAVQQLPRALMGAGVKVPTVGGRTMWLSSEEQAALGPAPTLDSIKRANPQKPGEGTLAYNNRIGELQWAANSKRNYSNTPTLPSGVQFHMVADGKYKIWNGGTYISDAKGRAAVWDYRSGKVTF